MPTFARFNPPNFAEFSLPHAPSTQCTKLTLRSCGLSRVVVVVVSALYRLECTTIDTCNSPQNLIFLMFYRYRRLYSEWSTYIKQWVCSVCPDINFKLNYLWRAGPFDNILIKFGDQGHRTKVKLTKGTRGNTITRLMIIADHS